MNRIKKMKSVLVWLSFTLIALSIINILAIISVYFIRDITFGNIWDMGLSVLKGETKEIDKALFGEGFMQGFAFPSYENLYGLKLKDLFEVVKKSDQTALKAGFYLGFISFVNYIALTLVNFTLAIVALIRCILTKSLAIIIVSVFVLICLIVGIVLLGTIGVALYNKDKGFNPRLKDARLIAITSISCIGVGIALSYVGHILLNKSLKQA